MAGKDINTWKMKRREKYEKPTAVRISDRDLPGIIGGEGCYSPFDPSTCSHGSVARRNCSGGSHAGLNCFMGADKD